MKSLLRSYLINFTALWISAKVFKGLDYSGGMKVLFIGAAVFMVINWLIVPLVRLLFLPLNLLTLGLFGWLANVIGLYILTVLVPEFKLLPFTFPGATIAGIIIPRSDLNLLEVAIIASFLIGLFSHFMQWLAK